MEFNGLRIYLTVVPTVVLTAAAGGIPSPLPTLHCMLCNLGEVCEPHGVPDTPDSPLQQ